jgi:hypothetical protein
MHSNKNNNSLTFSSNEDFLNLHYLEIRVRCGYLSHLKIDMFYLAVILNGMNTAFVPIPAHFKWTERHLYFL